VAQRLASRPRWSLPRMVSRLRTQINRLDELHLGDRAVRASFLVSWAALDDAQKKAFAALAVFAGHSFSAPAFAHVAEIEGETQVLDGLVALSLLSAQEEARYKQHPLLADYAREKLANPE